jgi:hypothetical protein
MMGRQQSQSAQSITIFRAVRSGSGLLCGLSISQVSPTGSGILPRFFSRNLGLFLWERHLAAMIIVARSHSHKHKKIEYGTAQGATPTVQHP